MTDFLDEKRQEIQGRMAELRPLIDEYQRLEAAASALEGVGGASSTAVATPARRGPGHPKGSGRKPGRPKGSGRKPGRPKGSGISGPGRPRKVDTEAAATAAAPAAATATKTPARRGRPPGRRKGSGTRAAQALAIVSEQPGVAESELAARVGIKQNYLYRVLPGLRRQSSQAGTRLASWQQGLTAARRSIRQTRTSRKGRPCSWHGRPFALNQAQLLDRAALFLQLLHARIDARA